MTTLTVKEMTKAFGPVVAVDRLSFSARPGRVTGFLGPNGSGKTTTLRVLLGLARPTSGSAMIGDREYRNLREPIRTVGAVLDSIGFQPSRTGAETLRVLAAAGGIPRSRIKHVLSLVDLAGAAGKNVGGYSLGMRQRLGLAAALLGDPEVLVLDEPLNGLDPVGIRWMRDQLRAFAAEGRTVLVSSHLLSEVASTVDDVVIVAKGRLLKQAPLSELAAPGQDLEDIFFSILESANPSNHHLSEVTL